MLQPINRHINHSSLSGAAFADDDNASTSASAPPSPACPHASTHAHNRKQITKNKPNGRYKQLEGVSTTTTRTTSSAASLPPMLPFCCESPPPKRQATYYEYSEDSKELVSTTLDLVATLVPGYLKFLRPFARRAICAIFDKPLLKALGIPEVSTCHSLDPSPSFGASAY